MYVFLIFTGTGRELKENRAVIRMAFGVAAAVTMPTSVRDGDLHLGCRIRT